MFLVVCKIICYLCCLFSLIPSCTYCHGEVSGDIHFSNSWLCWLSMQGILHTSQIQVYCNVIKYYMIRCVMCAWKCWRNLCSGEKLFVTDGHYPILWKHVFVNLPTQKSAYVIPVSGSESTIDILPLTAHNLKWSHVLRQIITWHAQSTQPRNCYKVTRCFSMVVGVAGDETTVHSACKYFFYILK